MLLLLDDDSGRNKTLTVLEYAKEKKNFAFLHIAHTLYNHLTFDFLVYYKVIMTREIQKAKIESR